MAAYDRNDYRKFSTEELSRRYGMAEDRSTRADTTEAYLQDMFVMQEIAAVISERSA